ncbi:MAG: hypothetical protein KF773_12370 [Deltaproteobacteria bacterium]|nr:hypothetical protein [Deltaproteobacteria bacterium]
MPSFADEFDAAFLSLDEFVIRAFFKKWKFEHGLPDDPLQFLASVHKVRTMITTLPVEARRLSRDWLLSYGMEPHPDPEFDRPERPRGVN